MKYLKKMNEMNVDVKIQDLEQLLNDYTQVISVKSLEYTPYIVEVGALTVGTDDNGVIITENKRYPMQFSKKAVDKILSMSFKDGNNKPIKPKVYTKYEWYSEQIDNIKSTLSGLKKLL